MLVSSHFTNETKCEQLKMVDFLASPTPHTITSMLLRGGRGKTFSADSLAHVENADLGAEGPASIAAFYRESAALPLSYNQEQMLAMHELAPLSTAYNTYLYVRLRENNTVNYANIQTRVQNGINMIVMRHEALRTVLVRAGDAVLQRVLRAWRPELRVASGDDAATAEYDELNAPFDLYAGPAVRALLLLGATNQPNGGSGVSTGSRLLLTVHHTYADGWSSEVLNEELSALLNADADVGDVMLPPPPRVQYADFAVWQRRRLDDDGGMAEHLEYWKQQLHGAPEALELVTDKPRPTVQTFVGDAVAMPRVDGSVWRALKRRGQAAHGTTPFAVAATCWAVVLGQHARQDEVMVGAAVHGGRERAALARTVGYLVNTVALRIDLRGSPDVDELFSRCGATVRDALAHSDGMWATVAAATRKRADPSRTPLYQTVVAMGEFSTSADDAEEGTTPARFDIELHLTKESADGSLGGVVVYNRELFERSTVERIAARLTRLMESMASAPAGEPARRLRMIDAVEELRVRDELSNWRRVLAESSVVKAAGSGTLVDMFAKCAAEAGTLPALVSLTTTLTYAETHARALGVAHVLTRLGASRGRFVGLCGPHDAGLFVGMHGVLLAGAAYVPLDPEYPTARALQLVSDCGAVAVVARQGSATWLGEEALSAPLVELSSAGDIISSADDGVQGVAQRITDVTDDHGALTPPHPADPCYVIYTSGSTGRPKGVVVPHRGVLAFLHSQHDERPLTSDDRLLLCNSYTFDASVEDIWMAVLARASLFVFPKLDLLNRLGALVNEFEITYIHATPSFLSLFEVKTCPTVRLVVSGGEALSPKLVEQCSLAPWCVLHNSYGPTEVSITATQIARRSDSPSIPASCIGAPLRSCVAYILRCDVDGDSMVDPELVAVGVPGELCLAGTQVADGYLNRPEATAHAFVANPFCADDAPCELRRMYRTGDLCRWREDGTIEFLGRIDSQVKVRGHRIELGEIEAVMLCDHSISAVAVAVESGERLVACVSPRPDAVDSPSAEGSADTSARARDADIAEVEAWTSAFDYAWAKADGITSDPTLNFSGYANTYTPGAMHTVATISEWAEETVRRVAALEPRRVLELGCGSGMILFRVARLPGVERCVGADISAVSTRYLEEVAPRATPATVVFETRCPLAAHESTEFCGEKIDTIICNCVSQYFSSLEYLELVIRNAMTTLAPGGAFFLGDVRSLPHHLHCVASTQLFHAVEGVAWEGGAGGGEVRQAAEPTRKPGAIDAGSSFEDFATRVAHRVEFENEFLIDPAFFVWLLRGSKRLRDCARVRIDAKRGDIDSEFSLFRYDVTLFKGGGNGVPSAERQSCAFESWDAFSPSSSHANGISSDHRASQVVCPPVLSVLAKQLSEKGGSALRAITRIPDKRLVRESRMARILAAHSPARMEGVADRGAAGAPAPMSVRELEAELCKAALASAELSVSAEDLYALGESLG